MAITRKIGEKFQADDGTWLEVVKSEIYCGGCYYYTPNDISASKCISRNKELTGYCTLGDREENIIFSQTTPPEIKYSFADEKDFHHLDYFKSYLFHMQVDSVKLITSENKDVTLVVKSRKPLEFEVV